MIIYWSKKKKRQELFICACKLKHSRDAFLPVFKRSHEVALTAGEMLCLPAMHLYYTVTQCDSVTETMACNLTRWGLLHINHALLIGTDMRKTGVGWRHDYLLQGPAPASPQKSTPLFLSICFDMPEGRG